jgi:hypothetical protein
LITFVADRIPNSARSSGQGLFFYLFDYTVFVADLKTQFGMGQGQGLFFTCLIILVADRIPIWHGPGGKVCFLLVWSYSWQTAYPIWQGLGARFAFFTCLIIFMADRIPIWHGPGGQGLLFTCLIIFVADRTPNLARARGKVCYFVKAKTIQYSIDSV